MQPSASEVHAALERILASAPFAGGGRAGSLLRYLVERTLDGRGDTLKEYVLGVELFNRGDGFDPRVDTIVRVEARRLRAKLDGVLRRSRRERSVADRDPARGLCPDLQRERRRRRT